MKKTSIIIVAIVMMAGLSTRVMAQNTATANAGAKIVQAISIVKNADLHFGTMSIPTGAVNVLLSTGNVRTASVPANITLLAQAPTTTNAAYTVTGSVAATYAITLPLNGVVTISSGANSMPVDDFVALTASTSGATTGSLGAGGSDTFVVGATLKLANAQPAGVYTGTYDVSVAYN